ncbi:DUF2161 domain-containing phosphodiesterase [Bacillus weihaiensis]|uniref:DUF2161 domain-containing phosphodiesterase n=1 Tax=Bacillus weihaiensis TaxID=1547283 RepID=UPI002357486E|nr:DUF2161 family putative PD-(D/E)XK-type phosphodiesterase [Bacillus weihaiensis]
MQEKEKRQEIDLYKPIQRYFIKEGYEVYGEVKDCDLAAVKEDSLLIVELKLNLTVDLLIQATKRQKLTDQVYIAIPKPKVTKKSRRWRDICQLVQRLDLGLIVVSLESQRKKVDIVCHPPNSEFSGYKRVNKRKRENLLKEVNGRSADYNVGGSTRTKIMTAYKENCIQIAVYLHQFGELSPKKLKELGTGEKTSSILMKNYYRWFDRVRRGVYILNETGIHEIAKYPEIVQYYISTIQKKEQSK